MPARTPRSLIHDRTVRPPRDRPRRVHRRPFRRQPLRRRDRAGAGRRSLDQGLVRVIDLAVVSKAATAAVSILETQELSPEVAAAFVKLEGEVSGLLSEADLEELAEALEPGTTAAALLFEHVWATRFADAVRAANGELVLVRAHPPRGGRRGARLAARRRRRL